MADREEVQRVVWHTPTEYDPLKHGPPYLPGVTYEPVKLSSEERAGVRSLVKKAAEVGVHPMPDTPLVVLLACLQALAMLHQSHHWSTRGSSFYADHLLFERLYNESLESIDQVAERAVGLGQPSAISAYHQVQHINTYLQSFGFATTASEMVNVSLNAETAGLAILSNVMASLEAQGHLSHGVSNLLEGVADKHESFVYLLQQRAQAVFAYAYDRR